MTTILEQARDLETQLKNGQLSREEYDRLRSSMFDGVEDAELLVAGADVAGNANPGDNVWHIAVLLIVSALCCTALFTWLFGDLNLALTISSVLMAAIAVRACQKLLD